MEDGQAPAPWRDKETDSPSKPLKGASPVNSLTLAHETEFGLLTSNDENELFCFKPLHVWSFVIAATGGAYNICKVLKRLPGPLERLKKKMSSFFSSFSHENRQNIAAQIKNHSTILFLAFSMTYVMWSAMPSCDLLSCSVEHVCLIYPTTNTKGPVTFSTKVCTEEKQLVLKESQEVYWLSNHPRPSTLVYQGAVCVLLDWCFLLECIFRHTPSIAWFQMKEDEVKMLWSHYFKRKTSIHARGFVFFPLKKQIQFLQLQRQNLFPLPMRLGGKVLILLWIQLPSILESLLHMGRNARLFSQLW